VSHVIFDKDTLRIISCFDMQKNSDNSSIGVNPRTRAKHWAGCTINNWTQDDIDCFDKNKDSIQYFVYGKELGGNQVPHLQFMVSFYKQLSLTAVSKMFPRAHLEVKSRRSTFLEASAYCKKDGDFTEWGILPLDQQVAGAKATSDKWADTKTKAKAGLIEEIDPEFYIKYYRTLKQIAADNKPTPPDLTWKEGQQPNFWIVGPTRTGKSWKGRELTGPGRYLKNAANKWWDKYNAEENVLIEDLDKIHSYQGFYLKIWADKYAFPVEIKNGGDLIRPKMIVVTSNYKIEEIFPDPSTHLPLMERFKIITLTKRWDDTVNTVLKFSDPTPKKRRKSITEGQRPFKMPRPLKINSKGIVVPNTTRQATMDEHCAQKIVVDLTQSISHSSSSCSEEEVRKIISISSSSSSSSSSSFEDEEEVFPWGDCIHCGAGNVEVKNHLCNICEELIGDIEEWLSKESMEEEPFSKDEDDLDYFNDL